MLVNCYRAGYSSPHSPTIHPPFICRSQIGMYIFNKFQLMVKNQLTRRVPKNIDPYETIVCAHPCLETCKTLVFRKTMRHLFLLSIIPALCCHWCPQVPYMVIGQQRLDIAQSTKSQHFIPEPQPSQVMLHDFPF